MNNRIAVVIPAHNEEQVLSQTVEALFKAGVNQKDIYVVDDASKDRTSEIAKSLNVHLLTLKQNVGKAIALRKLIHYFCLCQLYDYVVFLDADTLVDENILVAFNEAANKDKSVSLFVGQVKSVRGGFISAGRAVEYAIGQDLFKSGMSKHGLIFVAPGCASLYRTDVLAKLKFEGDTLAEDMDLTMQVQRLRGKIVYVPEAIVNTQDPGSVKDYIKQVTRWFRGTWQVVRKHRILTVGKKQKVDLMMIFLMLDALIFNRLLWIFAGLTLFSFTAKAIVFALLMDAFVTFLVAVYASVKNKRLDVIYKFPLYFWMTGYLNPYLFLKTFVEIMVVKKEVLVWNKVARY